MDEEDPKGADAIADDDAYGAEPAVEYSDESPLKDKGQSRLPVQEAPDKEDKPESGPDPANKNSDGKAA